MGDLHSVGGPPLRRAISGIPDTAGRTRGSLTVNGPDAWHEECSSDVPRPVLDQSSEPPRAWQLAATWPCGLVDVGMYIRALALGG
jgi:hypothetical protein